MPQRALNTPICRDCDGFSTAAITTGTRNTDGTRNTLTIACPICKGTGHTAPATGLAHAGR
ncbi:hypothetical protein [Streptomyces griseofuscus]|uniref:Uncharacterized protein n=1 Tax=Streptomyces griseofuscus TaxID=146922 RepID=A0A3R8RMV6_9ACTN|nr:hypothetical protein [Streptomyces griseofuscus]RRQ87278.1 hypothetical protein CQW44_10020 [Streptomyces griseofuscus]